MEHIKYDGPLDVATGRSRKELNWKNKATTWGELLTRLSSTHITAETYAEYLASKKPRQDEIKDCGAFLGGYLANGKRKSGSVNFRQIITLDVDFAPLGFWDDFTLMYGCAAAVYSTHKHSPDKPRLRLVIPLDRHVLPDEYTAISRKIAGVMGIDFFDPTTYQPERLMYWPSTSKDGSFFFASQDGPWLSADEVLESYRDWTDTSEWPTSDSEGDILHRAIKKQGDPLEKRGIVGAFCRTFNIHEAIAEHLSDVYTPCDVEGRYSYVNGTTSAGLVTYDDLYAYSHHGTDPISMKLCNAFDLVRIHLFGLRDENVSPNTPVNKTPSFAAMEDLACKDERVRKLIVNEKLQNAADDFAEMAAEQDDDFTPDTLTEAEPESDDWKGKLDTDKKGNIASTVDNIVILMENAPELKGRFAFDEFAKKRILLKGIPGRLRITPDRNAFEDSDLSNLYHHFEKAYGITATKLPIVLDVMYSRYPFHPVKNYINSLKWDGVERAANLFIDYLGAENSKYTKAVTVKMLVAAIARVFQPGIKFDTVLTLVGEQGRGKSTIFRKLAGAWFSDNFSFNMIRSKEGSEQIQGHWIIEIGEMSGFRKADRNEAKNFISRSEDTYRPAYGHFTVTALRQCIFVSTTNETDFLSDPTGNRRYWPVKIGISLPLFDVFKDLTPEIVGQIWAEAYQLYKKGETIYLSQEMEAVARDMQTAHTEEHPWKGLILAYLDKLLPVCWGKMDLYNRRAFLESGTTSKTSDFDEDVAGTEVREQVCAAEIWAECLKKDSATLDQVAARTINSILRGLPDWQDNTAKLTKVKLYGPQRVHTRKNGVTSQQSRGNKVLSG